ncbi:polysaccharide biosynthesis protein [Metabacillus halosaccharovorans]|uniref:polysaccharide biosynthesis protein n=1 Tax=Metabacillus halosaccharovorans TaxID=930124 RepID=UPI0020A736EC|nr:polysaccharide biosynthesis protein [Metabacillus halosaccharovorans]
MIENELKNFYKDKNILVTGGTGSIGRCIVSSLLKYQPNKIIIFNRDDSKQYLMKQKYQDQNNVQFHLGDIREYDAVEYITRNIDYVFHVAALKQVPICEDHPFEAVKTNVCGSENIIKASIINKVKKVVNVSTDKAVNPTSTMGVTKLMSEKLFCTANNMINNSDTVFCSVRFGNVINSRGSVIPLFLNQAQAGEPLTLTDPDMTRFIMTISDAAQLTLKSAFYSQGEEIFIFKMKSLNILDLAEAIQTMFKKQGFNSTPINYIGKRPGEKLYEELINSYEFDRIVEDDELYVILPKITKNYHHFKQSSSPMIRSDQVVLMTKEEIINYLINLQSENSGD